MLHTEFSPQHCQFDLPAIPVAQLNKHKVVLLTIVCLAFAEWKEETKNCGTGV